MIGQLVCRLVLKALAVVLSDYLAKTMSQWQHLMPHETPRISYNLVNIGDKIWYSTDYQKGEKGMVEYCPKTNKVVRTVKYSEHMYLKGHSICRYRGSIYIVDGRKGNIILFNPSTQTFDTKTTNMPKIGVRSCCIAIHDAIHIFHGSTNTNSQHLIYSIPNNTIHSLKDPAPQTTDSCSSVAVLKYKNKIIRFGGKLDSFYLSSDIKQNASNHISWTLKRRFKLKHPLSNFGYVLYKQYVIIFGGQIGYPSVDTNRIYVLDLEGHTGWKMIPNITCPVSNSFYAVLAGNSIHIFTGWIARKHFSISITDVLGDLGVNVVGDELNENEKNEDPRLCPEQQEEEDLKLAMSLSASLAGITVDTNKNNEEQPIKRSTRRRRSKNKKKKQEEKDENEDHTRTMDTDASSPHVHWQVVSCSDDVDDEQLDEKYRGRFRIKLKAIQHPLRDNICYNCGKCGALVRCDGCPHTFHLLCVGLCVAPTEKWFCNECEKKRDENDANTNNKKNHNHKKRHFHHMDQGNGEQENTYKEPPMKKRKINEMNDTLNNNQMNEIQMLNVNNSEDLVGNWLSNIVGLPQYVNLFIDQGYDDMITIVETMNEMDLHEIGVEKKGHRKKILLFAQKYKNEQ
eukprot:266594_1